LSRKSAKSSKELSSEAIKRASCPGKWYKPYTDAIMSTWCLPMNCSVRWVSSKEMSCEGSNRVSCTWRFFPSVAEMFLYRSVTVMLGLSGQWKVCVTGLGICKKHKWEGRGLARFTEMTASRRGIHSREADILNWMAEWGELEPL